MNSENRIDFNFTYFALKALGNSLYSNPWVAISELVANGLDAGATEVKVMIDLRNKDSATIEIFDNGIGMDYEDIANKYAIIGRNKREEEANEKYFGRKGVGKLASLYLTHHYYISTKNSNEHSTWEIDTSKYKDSDIPGLEKVSNKSIDYLIADDWKQTISGTIIKLVNVNLKTIGEKKINSLKAILADYYSSSEFGKVISVAIVENNDVIKFENISKKVYFDTFYAMFDNTGNNLSRMSKSVYLTEEDEVFPEIDYPRDTRIIKESIPCLGVIKMKNLDGKEIDVSYEVNGWIGVNCSLKTEVQRRNSPTYEKHIYRGNELKLYVRGKMAVPDLMKYIGSTQVGSNYIEGEISFDVLDRDDLEDTATTNREGYKIDDPRVQKLIQILSPIVKDLITARSNIGSLINKQNIEISNAKDEQLKNEIKSKETLKEVLLKVEEDKKKLERKNVVANKRLLVLERNFIGSGENYKNGMHLAVNYAKAIKSNSIRLAKTSTIIDKEHIIDISAYAENIIRLNKLLGKAKFSLDSKIIKEDLFVFIKDYVKVVSTSSLQVECNFDYSYITEFEFCEMSMALENIISNSKKATSTKLDIFAEMVDGEMCLIFKDDGKGLDPTIEDANDIFKIGYSKTRGTGIGGYLIHKTFMKLSKEIIVENNNINKGISLRVILNEQV